MRTCAALVVVQALAAAAAASSATCYFPDGSVSPADIPCSSAAVTHCCNNRNACLSTGYCISASQQPYVLSRSSCTDQSWGTGCPTHCKSSNDNTGGGLPISWLGRQDSSGNQLYCCGTLTVDNGTVSCLHDDDPFTLGASTLMFGGGILTNATNTTAAAVETSSSSSPTASETSSTAAAAGSSSNTTAVGVGVGVPLGVLMATAVAWALWERRRRAQQVQALISERSQYLAAAQYYSDAQLQQAMAAMGQKGSPSNPSTYVELSACPGRREELPAHS